MVCKVYFPKFVYKSHLFSNKLIAKQIKGVDVLTKGRFVDIIIEG